MGYWIGKTKYSTECKIYSRTGKNITKGDNYVVGLHNKNYMPSITTFCEL